MDRDLELLWLSQYQASLNDEDEDEAALIQGQRFWFQGIFANVPETQLSRSREMINRCREAGHARMWADYFQEKPIYPDKKFRRRFRMYPELFDYILQRVVAHDSYFTQRQDATHRVGLSSHQKITGALRFLANGVSADIWGEYLCFGESTLMQTVKKFCTAIVEIFSAEYCRDPTPADVARLTEQNSMRGFPGMLGSIDCMHWKWKNCPTAWQGQYRGHKQAPTIILEAVASYDTWIWKSFFGMPGSCNDINVLHRSTVFRELLHGNTAPLQYEINGNAYNMGYYLGDGIYPPYATIVKTLPQPTTPAQRLFSQCQEGARKDVERAFGILQARFAFIRDPAKLWNREAMATIMKACIIMHNMIVENEGRADDWRHAYDGPSQPPEIFRHQTDSFYNYLEQDARMCDRDKHNQLRNDLVAHIWNMHGANDDEDE